MHWLIYEPRHEKIGFFAYAKTKTQISFAETAKLISAFVFALYIVQSLYFLNPKFQASSHLLSLYSLVCVGPGRKPRRPVFSQRGSYVIFEPLHDKTNNVLHTNPHWVQMPHYWLYILSKKSSAQMDFRVHPVLARNVFFKQQYITFNATIPGQDRIYPNTYFCTVYYFAI